MKEEQFRQAKAEYDAAQAEQGIALWALARVMEERLSELPPEVVAAWKDWRAKLNRTIDTGVAANEIGEQLKRDLDPSAREN